MMLADTLMATLIEPLTRWLACLGLRTSGVCRIEAGDGWTLLALILIGYILVQAGYKLATAVVTVRALAFSPTFSRRLSKWVMSQDYSDEALCRADGANERWVAVREQALDRLALYFRTQYTKSIAWGNAIRDSFSDLRFTDANRVPFPFMRVMRERFNLCSVVTEADGPLLRDLDDHWTLDVSGSYGVNVAGFDRYKEWIQKGWERVKDLGPVLGPLHPVVAENITMLKSISKMDEVSFHMSGTEAVMAAVRLARFNTRRKLIVCFSGAYHGWWDGVQPGLGSERELNDCLTLKDLNPASLDVIRWRAKEIAGVLINPVQSFHPNSPPPSDAVLLTGHVRKAQDVNARYAEWLHQLRQVCEECDVPLIFDEVYTGFRLAPGGAQEYFKVRADIVVYGKTVAGGMPIGVVCGKKELMRRFDPKRPMRIAYVIGTFSAHPPVMGAMNEFLRWVTQPEADELYTAANTQCTSWVQSTNKLLVEAALPLRIVNLATVWTVLFKAPSRYNWLLQYYLRAEGMTLSWVGTGRCLSSLDFSPEHYQSLQKKLLNAAYKMKNDGWWLSEQEQPGREKKMRLRLLKELLGSMVRVPEPVHSFYAEVMRRKRDDHAASHSNTINQIFHILSSSVFIYCYCLIFSDLTTAVCAGLAALFVRQFGHAVLEPPCHDKEELLLGFNTSSKTFVAASYLLIPAFHMLSAGTVGFDFLLVRLPEIAEQWFLLTVLIVSWHIVYLIWEHDFRASMIWFVKFITDPITDIISYTPHYLSACQTLLPALIRRKKEQ